MLARSTGEPGVRFEGPLDGRRGGHGPQCDAGRGKLSLLIVDHADPGEVDERHAAEIKEAGRRRLAEAPTNRGRSTSRPRR